MFWTNCDTIITKVEEHININLTYLASRIVREFWDKDNVVWDCVACQVGLQKSAGVAF